MKIDITTNKQKQTDTQVVLLFEKEKVQDKEYKLLVEKLITNNQFQSKSGEVLIHPIFDEDKMKSLVLVGLGKKDEIRAETLAKVIGNLVKSLESKKNTEFDLVWPQSLATAYKDKKLVLKLIIKYFYLSTYKFNEYQASKKEAVYLQKINIIGLSKDSEKVIDEMDIIGQAINYTRDLNNSPSSKVTPQYFVQQAEELAKNNKNLKVKSLGVAEMKKLGMGGLLGVSSGSQHKPEFIILEYLTGPKNLKPVVFVGKSITFDSGGISLKPGDKMDEMKMDMSGGGAVLGAFKAISEIGLKANVIGLIPACENMPSGGAYKPGDILQAMNKKTIEVLNTDAEGRIILADALSYASKYKPEYVVDLATLTGACLVALGTFRAGLLGNDQKLVNKIHQLSGDLEEFTWELPLDYEYSESIKSKIADVRNISAVKGGGTITAAAFLKEFVDYPWAHLDIAGVAWTSGNKPWLNVGSTGYGVHLLTELVQK